MLNKMKESAEGRIRDYAFKENMTLSLLEMKAIDYDTISENHLDTLRILKCTEKMDNFKKLFDSNMELVRINMEQAKLSGMIGSKTLLNMEKEEAQKYLKEAEKCRDSILYYHILDSLTRIKITNRKEQRNFYKTRIFIKATLEKGKDKNNILDTVFYIFDQNLNIINNIK
jgi:hypothetical protein